MASSSASNVIENLCPQTIRGVAKEIKDLIINPPDGMKIKSIDHNITDIHAYIEGPLGTPYNCGTFEVKLTLGKGFPTEPPKAYFLTKIFHPNVSANGEICVNTLKKDWKSDLGIKHVLLTIKCLLIAPNPESALNEEAGKLLLEKYDDYFQRAKLMTEIHAQLLKNKKTGSDGPLSQKHDMDKIKPAAQKKLMDRKRALKRL